MSAISGPVPPYANVPIAPQNYKPRSYEISGITLGNTTIVTTSDDLDYVVSQQIRLVIPEGYGCTQLNGASGYVLELLASNQVKTSINSSQNVDPFISASLSNKPQILGIGGIANGYINPNGQFPQLTTIPGSFTNIS